MSKYYRFSGMNDYDTPEGVKKSWLFPLMGKSRLYFYFDNFLTFCLSGRAAQKGKLDKDAQIYYSSRNVDLVAKVGGKLHIRNLQYLREVADTPVVVIANHMSLFETGILHAICREYLDFSFVIKESLLHTPYMKDILNSFNAIAVTRTNPREDLKKVLTEGKKCLESGRALIIFPQATRDSDIHPDKFSSIGIKLAKSAGVKVLPLALKTDIIVNGKGKFRDVGPVHPENEVWFEFAPAMEITGNGQEQQEKIIQFLSEKVKYWRSLEKPEAKEVQS